MNTEQPATDPLATTQLATEPSENVLSATGPLANGQSTTAGVDGIQSDGTQSAVTSAGTTATQEAIFVSTKGLCFDRTWQPLDPMHLAMEMRFGWIALTVVALVVCTTISIVGWLQGWGTLIFLAVAAGVVFLMGLLAWSQWFVVPRSHRSAGWMLSERGIEIRKGIWWKHVIVIPKERIQHSDLQQGPLLRAYGLANLVIFTAGTDHARIEVSGLSHDTAQMIRDRLLEFSHEAMGGV